MKRLKRVGTAGLAFLLAFMLLPVMRIPTLAAETEEIGVDVVYNQTSAREMLDYINKFRAGNDVDGQKADYWNSDNATKTDLTGTLSPLVYDYSLERTAMQRAAEIAMSFSHTRPNGELCFSAWKGSWDYIGENIAAGYSTAYNTFVQWREDEEDFSGQGHRRNMLGNFTRIGIGHVVFNGMHFWSHAFGTGTGDDTETEALDGAKNVIVPVDTANIKNLSLSKDPESYTLTAGKSKDLPKITATLQLAETWPARNFPIQVSANWSSANSSIASVNDAEVTGMAAGDTTLTAQILGTEVSVPVQVSEAEVTPDEPETPVAPDEPETPVAPVLTKYAKKAATCVADGHQEYWRNEETGQIYADEAGTKALSEIPVIKALGHSWNSGKVTKAATVLKTGVKTYTCTRCGATKTKVINKLTPSIKLSVTKKKIKVKKSFTLTISKLAKGDSVKSVKSDNTKIATVKKLKGNQYKITGKKKGKAVITVILKSGKKATCTVTVKK